MCELLIRVVDKINAQDKTKDCKLTKRGDVIVLCDDGWPWQKEELANPAWRLLRVQGISAGKLTSLTQPEIPADIKNPSQFLQSRAYKVDIDSPEFQAIVGKAWINDAERFEPKKAVTLTLEEFMAFRVQKPPIKDPDVIAAEPEGIR